MNREHNARDRVRTRKLVPDWRPTGEQVLWAVWITVALVVLLGILTLLSSPFGITLWQWVKLLIIPAVVAAIGIWFNRQQRERELEVAAQRAQDEALQAYLDQMAQLMLREEADATRPEEDKHEPFKPKPLRYSAEHDEVRILARARTLTVLRRLDSGRKRSVVDFLYEADLIKDPSPIIVLGSPDSQYSAADLSGADLRDAFLASANLSGSVSGANLSGADLRGAQLVGANLSGANLYEADLSGANLSGANLYGAQLVGANLSGANLSQAKLEGATMPDGQILKSIHNPDEPTFEEWLKDREGRKEDAENGGPS